MQSVLTRDALRPPSPGGGGKGFALSLLVHGGLVVALALAVKWHSSEPAGVSAELWAAVPQVAAPKVETPPPPPQPEVVKPAPPAPPPKVDTQQRDAQIAIEKRQERERQLKREAEEKAQREKLQRDKAEREKAEKEKAEAQRKQKEEEQRLAKLREDQLKRMMGQVGATGAPTSTGTAAKDAGPSANYAGRIRARIKPNIVLTDEVPGNPVAEVKVLTSPDGTIVGRTLVKSSGVKEWDEAVMRAIDRTGVLPRDTDGTIPPSMTIAFSRRD